MRKLVGLLVIVGVVIGGAWIAAGFSRGPAVEVVAPESWVGLFTELELAIEAPQGRVTALELAVEQQGERFVIADPATTPDGVDRLRVTAPLGPQALPGLESGPATLTVRATRPVLGGLREVATTVAHALQVRYEPPRISILSRQHYINQGGAEVAVYRVTPSDVVSGVAVGEHEYPGFPASGLRIDGLTVTDPSIHVAFFALLDDQTVDTPMRLFARDPAGNAAGSQFDTRAFTKRFRERRIEVPLSFMERVVPAILAGTTEIQPAGSIVEQYVAINSDLRRRNAERIAALAGETSAELLWTGAPFHSFVNNAVEAGFADRRTYIHEGREIDRQVHLGYDLASVAQAPIVAAARGRVVLAEELGIYGNCVIIDHGMGLQSLYAHLSSIDVQPGTLVDREQTIGRSGMTGLAGGDHLHFTMLVHGRMVNPLEWWDPHWLEDRILRKLRALQ